MKEKKIIRYEIFVLILLILCLFVFMFRETLFAEHKFSINSTWEKYTPCNELDISFEQLDNGIIVGKTTKSGLLVIWTSDQLDEDIQNIIIESLDGTNGIGKIKNVEFISGDEAYSNGLRVSLSEGKVILDSPSSWALLYLNSYDLTVEEKKDSIDDKILDPLPEIKEEEKGQEIIVEPQPEQENKPIEIPKDVDTHKDTGTYVRPNTGIN